MVERVIRMGTGTDAILPQWPLFETNEEAQAEAEELQEALAGMTKCHVASRDDKGMMRVMNEKVFDVFGMMGITGFKHRIVPVSVKEANLVQVAKGSMITPS